MPLRSMTGFGLSESATPSGLYRVEIRGVNNRFLETQIRLPKFALNLEPLIKKELQSKISRGSVVVIINCDKESESTKLSWDKSAVENYVRIFREIKDQFSLAGDVALGDILKYSDVVKMESVSFDESVIWSHVQPIIAGALDAFQKSRENEAAFIVKDLKKILNEISSTVAKVELRAPARLVEYSQNLSQRIQKLLESPADPQRLATEVALFADRLDISEECTRLNAHVEKLAEDFLLDEPVGKRMNFLLQEMNREANTIGSKANDTEISHLSVLLKENIEKIREQIQNME